MTARARAFAIAAFAFALPMFAQEWAPFAPKEDPFTESAIDLRHLNEKFAGERGWIRAKEGKFHHSSNSEAVRFWAVNGPPSSVKDPADLRKTARILAKRGVNLVRIHGAVFTKEGEVDEAKVQHVIDIVEAMKTEGIYCHASIYFPLWFRPSAELSWLKGYDGGKHPFAALMFNPEFQAKFRQWWEALLLTPGKQSGRKLIDEPALMGVEIQNEDSFFFWTFSEQNIPDPQLRILEGRFAKWLEQRHGSVEAAFTKWGGARLKRDAAAEGRVAFRPLWNIANERTLRDQETAQFLLEEQSGFYEQTSAFIRKLGFKGLVTASNWSTASPEYLGPLEKLSYTTGDFMDRHGYFACFHKGDNAEWSIRNGHTYADRSALRFEPVEPGKPRSFVHPAMDVHYDDKPSMISETTWTRPNRYRSEAPLYYAAYGALQDSDAIVHFAHDGAGWNVKPNFWMQPWTLMSPAMIGQFPAAALIYRKGLVSEGEVVAQVTLNTNDLRALKGTPMPQEAALDELRLKDLPQGGDLKPGQRLDPLVHYVGRTHVRFSDNPAKTSLKLGQGKIDHTAQKVTSSTGQLQLDYGRGALVINSPQAQGVSGNLRALGESKLPDATISSGLDLAHVVLVSLDSKPIASSARMLLQVMSEERNDGWEDKPVDGGKKEITSIGKDPWTFKRLSGTVRLTRSDAAQLAVTPLDHNGYPLEKSGAASEIKLRPETVYYLIEKK